MKLRELLTDEPATIYFKAQTSEETPLGVYSWNGKDLTSEDGGEYTVDQEVVGWVWGDGNVVVYVELPAVEEPVPENTQDDLVEEELIEEPDEEEVVQE